MAAPAIAHGAASNGWPLVLAVHCKDPTVAHGCSRDKFPMLMHAKAPGAVATNQRVPVDHVTVLGMSGSMGARSSRR